MPEPGQPVQAKQTAKIAGNWFTQSLQFKRTFDNIVRQSKFSQVSIDPVSAISTVSRIMAMQAVEIRKLQAVVDYVIKEADIKMPTAEEMAKQAGAPEGNGKATLSIAEEDEEPEATQGEAADGDGDGA